MTDDPGKQSIDSLSSKLRWPKRGILQRTLVLWLVGVILAEVVASGVTWPSVLQTFRSLSSSAAKATATASTQANATATAIATTVQANANATAQANANATATAQAQDQATAQAQDQATATAQAQGQATATAQAVASATAQAQDQATATAQAANANATATASVIAANPDPYPPGGGILALLDPLRDNSQGHTWDTTANCAFNGGAYHVSAPDIHVFASCAAKSTNFSNFAYEVQMQIIKGDTGGIIFRADTAHNTFYQFYVSDTGNYELLLCSSNTCHDIIATTSSPAIHQGLNQTNLVAVVAIGNSITLYVNNQKIASVTDGTYSHGQIGLAASALATNGHPTEVVYSNAKVWMV